MTYEPVNVLVVIAFTWKCLSRIPTLTWCSQLPLDLMRDSCDEDQWGIAERLAGNCNQTWGWSLIWIWMLSLVGQKRCTSSETITTTWRIRWAAAGAKKRSCAHAVHLLLPPNVRCTGRTDSRFCFEYLFVVANNLTFILNPCIKNHTTRILWKPQHAITKLILAQLLQKHISIKFDVFPMFEGRAEGITWSGLHWFLLPFQYSMERNNPPLIFACTKQRDRLHWTRIQSEEIMISVSDTSGRDCKHRNAFDALNVLLGWKNHLLPGHIFSL